MNVKVKFISILTLIVALFFCMSNVFTTKLTIYNNVYFLKILIRILYSIKHLDL